MIFIKEQGLKVVHWGRARQFIRLHPVAGEPLKAWKKAAQDNQWRSYPDVKRTFNTVDWYDDILIFDIGGNKFRLIAICRFNQGNLYIQQVLTHGEYEKDNWKRKRRKD